MKPTLLIMAAGMGSRYGGIKQIEPVGAHKELIIDYSIYDALLAGFDRVVFIIRRDIERDFCESIFNRITKRIKAEYVFQDLTDLPAGFTVPAGRTKPWGTTHAILAARDVISTPFCVINADDFYGREAYQKIAGFFAGMKDGIHAGVLPCAMVGYRLGNTIPAKGHVSRGVCAVDAIGMLTEINERLHIEKHGGEIEYTTDDGTTWHGLSFNSDVSMNFWGFAPEIMPMLTEKFTAFLRANAANPNPKAESAIPVVVGELLSEGKITVKMLSSRDRWLGFTYPEDKDIVKKEMEGLTESGVYPSPLWEGR
jgi:dTDP-glucose pyrophosphorylase